MHNKNPASATFERERGGVGLHIIKATKANFYLFVYVSANSKRMKKKEKKNLFFFILPEFPETYAIKLSFKSEQNSIFLYWSGYFTLNTIYYSF